MFPTQGAPLLKQAVNLPPVVVDTGGRSGTSKFTTSVNNTSSA
jgi:hypothetical protein